jgi:hypothetical protein
MLQYNKTGPYSDRLKSLNAAKFGVFTEVAVKITVDRDVTPYSLVDCYSLNVNSVTLRLFLCNLIVLTLRHLRLKQLISLQWY